MPEHPTDAHFSFTFVFKQALKMLFRPGWFFIRSLLFGKGFSDGKRGLIRAYMASLYQIIYLSKLYENSLKNEQ